MLKKLRDWLLPDAASTSLTGQSSGLAESRVPPMTGRGEFLVIGLGRFGSSVAQSLVQFGHNVLAIDSDNGRVQAMAHVLPHVLRLDATNADALREIGADSFDTGLVCIGNNFEATILSTVLLRKLNLRRVLAKAQTRTQMEILLQVGADEVILPEYEAGLRLARRLAAIDFVDYLQLGPDVGVVELVVPHRLVGRSLIQADLRRAYGLTVLAVRRGNDLIITPPPDTVFHEGDILLVVGKIVDAERLV